MLLSSTLRFVSSLVGLVLFVFVACAAMQPLAPGLSATTGLVRGELAPLGAAQAVQLTGPSGEQLAVAPDSAGVFEFADLQPGAYLLRAVPVAGAGFEAPAATRVAVKPGEVSAASLRLSGGLRVRGRLSGKGDGAACSAAVFYGPASMRALYATRPTASAARRAAKAAHTAHLRIGRLDLHLIAAHGSFGFVASLLSDADDSAEPAAPAATQRFDVNL